MPTDDTSRSEVAAADAPAAFASAPLPYMRWAKAYLGPDPLGLGFSGLAPLAEDVRRELGLAPPPDFGSAPAALKAALAARYDLAPENVHPAAGTSHANFVVFFALARQGHVVVESPTYQSLSALATATARAVDPAPRDPNRGWRFDARALAAAVRPETSLIVATDLHNPSGARLHAEDLDLLVEAAESVGAHLLIDEVYADFDPQDRPTAAHRSPRVLVTNSLTKAHGLPDLRAGWILGDADTIAALDAWDDLVHPAQPPAPMAEAALYVPRARALLERTREVAAERTAQVDAWVQSTSGVRWTPPDGGITGFLLLDDHVDGDALATRLFAEHGVRAVPGSFFGRRAALRISYLLEEAHLAQALDALGQVLEAVR